MSVPIQYVGTSGGNQVAVGAIYRITIVNTFLSPFTIGYIAQGWYDKLTTIGLIPVSPNPVAYGDDAGGATYDVKIAQSLSGMSVAEVITRATNLSEFADVARVERLSLNSNPTSTSSIQEREDATKSAPKNPTPGSLVKDGAGSLGSSLGALVLPLAILAVVGVLAYVIVTRKVAVPHG